MSDQTESITVLTIWSRFPFQSGKVALIVMAKQELFKLSKRRVTNALLHVRITCALAFFKRTL